MTIRDTVDASQFDGSVLPHGTTTIEIDGNANTLLARGPAMLLGKEKGRVWMV